MIIDIRYEFEQNGVTPVIQVMEATDVLPLQQLIYYHTRHLLCSHDIQLSLEDKLCLPFAVKPTHQDWSKLMQVINGSAEMESIIVSDSVCHAFSQVLNCQPERYPISIFRAQFPGLTHSIYDWHQDMGTWYVVPEGAEGLAEKMAVTMWFSVGRADESNSIEIARGTHRLPLLKHNSIEKQGFFSAETKEVVDPRDVLRVRTKTGEAVFFHPMILHRSVQGTQNIPRYSIDIRYYDPAVRASYEVDPGFEALRMQALDKQTVVKCL